MPQVKFTPALKRFFPNLEGLEVTGDTIKEVVDQVENNYPGLKDYLVDETGCLRQHVNIFIGNELIDDEISLADKVGQKDEVFIMQAISGG